MTQEALAEELRSLSKQFRTQMAVLKEIRERIAAIETALEEMRLEEIEL